MSISESDRMPRKLIVTCVSVLFLTSACTTIRKEGSSSPDVTVLKGHNKLVPGLAFMPSGNRLISAGWDGTIRTWDLKSGKEISRVEAHPKRIGGLSVTPDGRAVASIAQDRTVWLWNAESMVELYRWNGIESASAVKFSSDGTLLYSTDFAKSRVWNVATHKEVLAIEHPNHSSVSICCSRNGKLIVTTLLNYGAFLWDDAGNYLARFVIGEPVWDTNELAIDRTDIPPQSWMSDISSDGKMVALASQSGAKVWDVSTQKELFKLDCINDKSLNRDFGNAVGVCDVRFSPNGKYLLMVGGGEAVYLVDTQTWRTVVKFHSGWRNVAHDQGYAYGGVWSPDGNSIAFSNTESEIRVMKLSYLLEKFAAAGH